MEAYTLLGVAAANKTLLDAMLDVTGLNFGLLNEQLDPVSGITLGNMRQALSHLALIHAVLSLSDGQDS